MFASPSTKVSALPNARSNFLVVRLLTARLQPLLNRADTLRQIQHVAVRGSHDEGMYVDMNTGIIKRCIVEFDCMHFLVALLYT